MEEPKLLGYLFKKNGLKQYKEDKKKFKEYVIKRMEGGIAETDKRGEEMFIARHSKELKPNEKIENVEFTESFVKWDILDTKTGKRKRFEKILRV